MAELFRLVNYYGLYPDIWMIPSGQLIVSYWKWPSRNSWFTHWTWWFPIVMLVYQRVYGEWCEMLNNVDMKWLEMIGVLKNSRFADNSEICIISPFWVVEHPVESWLNSAWQPQVVLLTEEPMLETEKHISPVQDCCWPTLHTPALSAAAILAWKEDVQRHQPLGSC